MEIAKMFKGHELFQSLSFEDVDRISNFSRTMNYEPGDVVFTSGERGYQFFVLLEGRVNLRLPATEINTSLVVGRIEKGDIFGLSPLLGFEHFTTTAQCAERSTILVIDVVPFREMLVGNTRVDAYIMNVIARAYFTRYLEILGRFQNILNEIALH